MREAEHGEPAESGEALGGQDRQAVVVQVQRLQVLEKENSSKGDIERLRCFGLQLNVPKVTLVIQPSPKSIKAIENVRPR